MRASVATVSLGRSGQMRAWEEFLAQATTGHKETKATAAQGYQQGDKGLSHTVGTRRPARPDTSHQVK